MTASTNRLERLLILASALLVGACVSTRLEPASDHPASAKAETTPLPERESLSTRAPVQESPGTTPATHVHDHAAPQADSYTCPMHPQVVKNAPGKCPICGMNLVKKEHATPQGAAH